MNWETCLQIFIIIICKHLIKIKHLQADFPIHIINDVFHRFHQLKHEVLIPQRFFEDRKECLVRLPFAPANERFVKSFINKLDIFTNYKVKFNVVWTTTKLSLCSVIKTN